MFNEPTFNTVIENTFYDIFPHYGDTSGLLKRENDIIKNQHDILV